MKRKVICIVMFVFGLSILLYPSVANLWNQYVQSRLIVNYQNKIDELNDSYFKREWEKVNEVEYDKALNINDDGVMGYLEIPKISLKLAIYHGFSDEVLEKGIGHLPSSSLPIGVRNNHCVLVGHRGLPKAKLFSDLDRLEIGDVIYLYVLDKEFVYEVDKVLDMVDKDDSKAFDEAFKVRESDNISLMTCTPYGINTHRLIVRGKRVNKVVKKDKRSFNYSYLVVLLVVLIIWRLRK